MSTSVEESANHYADVAKVCRAVAKRFPDAKAEGGGRLIFAVKELEAPTAIAIIDGEVHPAVRFEWNDCVAFVIERGWSFRKTEHVLETLLNKQPELLPNVIAIARGKTR